MTNLAEWLEDDNTSNNVDLTTARIIDYSQFSVAAVHIAPVNSITPEFVAHLILNTLIKNFETFNDVCILAVDGRQNWRRDIYTEYKYERRNKKEASPIDWEMVFNVMSEITELLGNYSKIKVVKNDKLEADDIIFNAAKYYRTLEIFSSDKDFFQLHRPGITQYSPRHGSFYEMKSPNIELANQILKGDRTDGVPNCLSQNNSFSAGIKQNAVTAPNTEKWHLLIDNRGHPTEKVYTDFVQGEIFSNAKKNGLTVENLRKYIDRNIAMVDLASQPLEYKKHIASEFDKELTVGNLPKLKAFCDKYELSHIRGRLAGIV